MALKVRGGQTVPALQAREPYFDGKNLHIGKLDGSGNQEIGGGSLPVFVIDPSTLEFANALQPLVVDGLTLDGESYYYYITQPGRYILQGGAEGPFAIYINIADGEYCEVSGSSDPNPTSVYLKGWENVPDGFDPIEIGGISSFPSTQDVYCFVSYTSEIKGEIKSIVMPFGYRRDFPLFGGGAR